MKIRFACTSLAAVLLASGACMSLSTTPADASGPTISRSIGAQIQEAQKDLQAKDFQGAMAALKQAQAASDLKPYDVYIINRLMVGAAIGLNDMATAASAEEAAIDSQGMPDDDKKAVLHDALQLSAFEKQWNKTITYGQQLQQMNGLDDETSANVALAYYNTNDFAHAQQFAQQSIDLAKAAGKQPNQNSLEIIMSSQAKQNNQAGAEQTLEQLAIQNNTPEYWSQLIDVALGTKGMNDADALYLYRLRLLAGAMTHPDDYTLLGSLSAQLGYPTEAVSVYRQGISSGKITSAQAGSTYSKAQRDAALDERTLPQIEASAVKSKNGEQDVKLGEDYWGYGRYADAEAAARRAIGKGGLKVPAEGPLLVGAAEVAQGKYADAIQTLAQVSGPEAIIKTAHLWSIYAQAKQKGQPAPAASPTPAQTPSP